MAATLEHKIQKRIEKLCLKLKETRISQNDLEGLSEYQFLRNLKVTTGLNRWSVGCCVIGVVCLLLSILIGIGLGPVWRVLLGDNIGRQFCLLSGENDITGHILRPPMNCEICRQITSIDRLPNITAEEFVEKYAYTGIPVVIINASVGWTAVEKFGFSFFKEIYGSESPVLDGSRSSCQFFPYKSGFRNLGEVFNMSEAQAELKQGTKPWYVGWSNCDAGAANILRQHYQRPHFLPTGSESSRLDWIFMGSPGYGAPMHVDNVGRPSWQAQIRGQKKWTLQPGPECLHVCQKHVEILVNPGDIIVLDTDTWYHQTLILGDEMSITIGSEFD